MIEYLSEMETELQVGVEKELTVPIKNISNKILSITCKASCGCSTPIPQELLLTPNESELVNVKIKKTSPTNEGFVNISFIIKAVDYKPYNDVAPFNKTKIKFSVT